MLRYATAACVKRVAVWWAGIEEWMCQELPEVEASLNQGGHFILMV